MIITASRPKAAETFPSIFNRYVAILFQDYPRIIESYRMPTQEDKQQNAEEMYKNVFGEDVSFKGG